ncbi:MAG: F0F1 ATP synthase subunit B [Candidatus Omnitrophica bacterium]|nr:F0F1 ATP synthase subunit B [Candidatus Omnitrophota bacterium]
MGILKLLSTNELITQIVNFFILLIIMRIFFWKRILTFLEERRARIAAEFKSIEDAKQETEKLKQEYEARLRAVEGEALAKIQEAADQGRKQAEEIRQKAYMEAQTIIDNAKASMRYEIIKAREKMKEEIIDLAMDATKAVIEEKLTEEDDKKLIEEFLKKIEVKR